MVQILLPPAAPGGSFIVGENGSLRMVDPPRKCWGRACGCTCKACRAEDERKEARRRRSGVAVLVCVCDPPGLVSGGTCGKCGHRRLEAA
jgi:hypothetical protein